MTQSSGSVASREYGRGWMAKRLRGGTNVVGNPTRQSLYMERGRGPGTLPVGVIQDWAELKGIVGRWSSGKKGRRGKFRKPRRFDGSLLTAKGNLKARRSTHDQKQRQLGYYKRKPRYHPIVWAIWHKVRTHGFRERRVLFRALLQERGRIKIDLHAAVKRTLRNASAANAPARRRGSRAGRLRKR